MFLNLLHFGAGTQALHYFIFCLTAILGTIQGIAVRYRRSDLVWLEERPGYALSALTVAGSFVMTDREIFIPGLAGGELFTLFVTALFVAIPLTRTVAYIAARVRLVAAAPARSPREKEPQS
jgi:hypothetical membrane protein